MLTSVDNPHAAEAIAATTTRRQPRRYGRATQSAAHTTHTPISPKLRTKNATKCVNALGGVPCAVEDRTNESSSAGTNVDPDG